MESRAQRNVLLGHTSLWAYVYVEKESKAKRTSQML